MPFEPSPEEKEDFEVAKKFINKVIDDRYEVSEVVAIGGMSYLFRGRHKRLDRDIAIKILKRIYSVNEKLVARFEQEAKVIAQVEHPNIVHVFDRGIYRLKNGKPYAEKWFYIIMEYLPGPTLEDILEKFIYFKPVEAYSFLSQILLGLQRAHSCGIVHRDLKPGNVKVVDIDRQPLQLKILDFGISRYEAADGMVNSGLTNVGDVFGTPHYMSPEQAQGKIVDRRSDIYAAGVLAFQILTGTKPFQPPNENPTTLLFMHVNEPPRVPSSVNSDLAPEIDAVVLKALAKDPADRYQDADEFRRALRKAILGSEDEVIPKGTIPPKVNLSRSSDLLRGINPKPPDPIEYAATVVSGPQSPVVKKGKKFPHVPVIAASAVALVIILGLILVSVSAKFRKSSADEMDEVEPVAKAKKAEMIYAEPKAADDFEDPVYESDWEPSWKKSVESESEAAAMDEHDLSPVYKSLWRKLKPHEGKSSCKKFLGTAEKIVENNPDFYPGHYWLYRCLSRSNPAKADKHFKKYLKLKPD